MWLLVEDYKARTSRGLLPQSLSGLTRGSEPSSSHLRKTSSYFYFGEELLNGVVVLYSLTWSSLSTLVKLASIMKWVLTHRSFSTNTPLGSGRFCYHLFCAEQRKTQRRRASWSEFPWGNQLLDRRIPLTFTSYAISRINAQHYCFATITISWNVSRWSSSRSITTNFPEAYVQSALRCFRHPSQVMGG